jgi:predicted ArsR family transcriptional regulator
MENFDALLERLAQLEKVNGITPVDILQLPQPLDVVVREMMRKGGMALAELASRLDLSMAETRRLGELLIEKGFLQSEDREESEGVVYKVYLARIRGRNISLDL